MSRTRDAGSDRTCFPAPHSYWTTNVTDAIHSPDGHRTHASWLPGHHCPSSASTSTGLGSGNRRTSSGTNTKVGRR
jgi:hypothetical protein